MPKIKYTDEQIRQLIDGIFNRVVNAHNLPKGLYQATAKTLISGLETGYNYPDEALLNELKNNIYMFSGAKTFQQVQHISSLLYKTNLDYKIFKEEALKIYENYNVNYLESEYVTALTSGTSAKSYKEAINSDGLFNKLRYVAVMDSHTSEICRRLNGTVMPTDSKFWYTNTPPNHFNCRCFVEKIDKYDTVKNTSSSKINSTEDFVKKNRRPQFSMNAAIDKEVFSKKHPYFSVPKQYKDLAKKNFNLPIPNKH